MMHSTQSSERRKASSTSGLGERAMLDVDQFVCSSLCRFVHRSLLSVSTTALMRRPLTSYVLPVWSYHCLLQCHREFVNRKWQHRPSLICRGSLVSLQMMQLRG